MAFTYDIATSRGKVRLGLADTQEATGIFTDAEIDHFLSVGGSVADAINEGLRQMARAHALRGDTARADAALAALAPTGGDLPTLSIVYPSALPMDQGFDETT